MKNIHDAEYRAWINMKRRCYNEKHDWYKRYGGRGIVVCERWKNSFENFFIDMGRRPSQGYSLDRIDNDGNYEPGNCRWATTKQQLNNTSVNRVLEFNGIKKSLTEWADQFGIKPVSLDARLTDGWPVEDALTIPIKKPNKIGKDDEVKTFYESGKSIKEIAEITGINYYTACSKIRSLRKRGLVDNIY